MNRTPLASFAALGILLAACASESPDEIASSTSHLEAAQPLAFFQAVSGSIAASASTSYSFEGRQDWTVDVIAATPSQKISWRAPGVTVTDTTTGATILDQNDGLPVQGRSGHTVRLPSTGTYVVTLMSLTEGVAQDAFTLEIEPSIPCDASLEACPASLSCQPDATLGAGRCWPANLGPQLCDASGQGVGCVPAGHTECDVVPGSICEGNSFICARTGGELSPQSCLGATGVCCHKGV